jgi:hypothetical protein
MSAVPSASASAREGVAGFIAAASLFASLLGVVYRPARIIPAAILLALVATRMTERHSKLAALAVAAGAACFAIGMTIAVLTKNPLY